MSVRFKLKSEKFDMLETNAHRCVDVISPYYYIAIQKAFISFPVTYDS